MSCWNDQQNTIYSVLFSTKMSLVHDFPVPEMIASDWGRIFVGLGVGIGLTFQILNFAAGPKNKNRVFTLTNFWLIMSGVIHVIAIKAIPL